MYEKIRKEWESNSAIRKTFPSFDYYWSNVIELIAKNDFQNKPEIRQEFGSLDVYVNYLKAVKEGKVRILNQEGGAV